MSDVLAQRFHGILLAMALVAVAACQAQPAARKSLLPPPDDQPVPAADAASGVDTVKPSRDAAAPDTRPVAPDVGPDVGPDLPPADQWARGVKVGLVEAAQAVFIEIGKGSEVLPAVGRNAPIIEGRALFLRVHVTPDAGWTARRLRAVLTLKYGDGTTQMLEDTRQIAGPSDSEKLESTFNFQLSAAQVKPRTELAVSLYETVAAAAPEPVTPPRFPPTGLADLGVKEGRMVMEAVLVPVLGPSGPLDDSPARRKRLESYLGDVYPVQQFIVTWRQPMKINAKMGWSAAFKALQQLRIEDKAKPSVYYHLLMAKEDSNDAFLGLGSMAGPAASEAPNRIAMTNVSNHAVDSEMDTVSHEMGHNLGRQHAPGCNAGGVDPRFPHPNTGVGVDGYSIPEAAFKSRKKYKDVMGYCYPTWISDYTWSGFERRVRVISALDAAPTTPMLASPARALQGFHSPGQAPDWIVVPGTLVAGDVTVTRARQARITLASGETRLAAVSLTFMQSPAGPEERARQIAVDLPDEEIAAVEVSLDGQRFTVPRDVLDARP